MKAHHTRLLTAVLLLGGILPATAADHTSTWTGSTNSLWNIGGNWSTPSAPGTFPNNGSPSPTYDVIQTSGTAQVNQAITIEKYSLSSGATNSGQGFTLTLNDLLTWSGGTFDGSGVISATGGANLTGVSTMTLNGTRELNLGGPTTWSGGNISQQFSSTVRNLVGGDFTTTHNGTLSGGFMNNLGSFTKSGGGGTTTISSNFYNSGGTVNGNSGILNFTGGGNHTGTFSAGAGGTVQFGGGTHNLNAGASFTGAGTISLTGATVSVNAAVSSSAGTTFSMSGGILNGTGTLTLNGPVNFSGGQMDSSGIVNAAGSVTFSGASSKTLGSFGSSRQLNLSGTTSWTGGDIVLAGTSIMRNLAGGTFTTNFDGTVSNIHIGGTFNNAGIFTKSGGSGTTDIRTDFSNTGTVNVNSGTLRLGKQGSHTGAFSVEGGTLNFDGSSGNTHSLDAGITFSGAGTVQVTSGNVTVNTAVSTPTATTWHMNGGNLTGTSTLTLNGPLLFTSGQMDSSGIVNATGTTTFSGAASKVLTNTRQLNLSGTTSWTAGSINLAGTSTMRNLAGGTFTTNFDGTVGNTNLGGTFNNAGTFTKSGGTGTTFIQTDFSNTGTVNVNSGTLRLGKQGSHTGAFSVEGGTLDFDGGSGNTHNLNAGITFSGAGTVKVTSGNVSVNTAVSTPVATTWHMNGGNLTGTSTLTLNGPLLFTSGQMDSSGIVNATGTTTFSGVASKVLTNTRQLNLSGTTSWTAGSINLAGTSTMRNLAGGTFTTNFDGTVGNNNLGGTFNNAGIFTKNGGSGTTDIRTDFSNTGTVNVNSGTLRLGKQGSHTGAFSVEGGTLNFDGGSGNTHGLDAGVSFSGAGTVQVTSGNVSVNTALTSPTATAWHMNGGTLTGASTLTLNGPLTFTSGIVGGTGTLNANGGVTFSGAADKQFTNTRVTNLSGTSTWSGGNISLAGVGPVTLNNTASGNFTTTHNGTIGNPALGGTFNNAGTFTKSGGTGTTNIQSNFSNTGTVHVQTGTLAMFNGASPYNQSGAGSFTILESGTVLSTSSLNLNGGTLKGNGTVQGNVIAAATSTIAPGLSPGALTVNGNVTLGINSTLAMELGGLTQGSLYDYLDVNGVLTLAGMLDLDFINGFETGLPSGVLLTLATANSAILGSFSNVASGGYLLTNFPIALRVFYGAGSPYGAENLVVAIPEPSRAMLMLAGLFGLCLRRRRRPVCSGN